MADDGIQLGSQFGPVKNMALRKDFAFQFGQGPGRFDSFRVILVDFGQILTKFWVRHGSIPGPKILLWLLTRFLGWKGPNLF